MPVKFGLGSKRRKLGSAIAAFEVPAEEDNQPCELSGEERIQASRRLQDLGNIKAAEGHFSAALRCWDEALLHTPDKAALHEQKAQVYMEVGDTWSAIKSATQATMVEPAWAPGFLTLGRAQLNFGEPELAVASLEEAGRLDPACEDIKTETTAARVLAGQRRGAGMAQLQRPAVTHPPAG